MGIRSSILTLADLIDPRIAYWSVLMRSGKVWSEHSMVTTFKAGQRGVRLLDWGEDLVTTGDVYRVKELRLHCPDGRVAVLEITPDTPPFQFKTRSLDVLLTSDVMLEYMAIGRVVDKASGRCECFIWDYRPLDGQPNLVAYKASILKFGAWRDNITPLGALSEHVQGFRLA